MARYFRGEGNIPLWFSLITAGVDETDPHLFTRLLLINTLMYTVASVQTIFALFYLFVDENLILSTLNASAALLIWAAIYYVRKTKVTKLAGHLGAIAMIGFLISFLSVTQSEDLSVAWAFLAPFFIIMLNGKSVGVAYLSIFYVLVIPMAYSSIGIWQDGDWSLLSFFRFVAVMFLATIMALLIEFSQRLSNNRETYLRNNETAYLDELKVLSQTDALTGLYNRHFFNEIIECKIKKLANTKQELSFFMIDIDSFKAYNDSFGHQKGDEVIKKVADCIVNYVKRENDLVFRLGGEEFGGLIEGRTTEETELWLSGMVKAVADLNLPSAPKAEHPFVSISMGVCSSEVHSQKDFTELYKHADEGLYMAKQNGRNCAVKYSGSDSVEILG